MNLPLCEVQIDFEAVRKREAKQAAYSTERLKAARKLWNRAHPNNGTKAEQYLKSRGITCDLPDSLRFIPDLYHAPSSIWGMAMVANVEPTGGIHRTFFDKKGKRLPKSAKLMLGPCAGGAVPLSGPIGPLVVTEGIETGLALMSGLQRGPMTVWAALSTSGMKSLVLPDKPHRLTIATDGDPAGKEAGDKLATRASALGWAGK